MTNANWIWKPNEGIGLLRFGMSIDECREIHKNILKDDDDCSDYWITYFMPDENIYLDFEKSLLICVRSHASFFYRNRNLIGMTLNDLVTCLGITPDEGSSESDCVEYEDGDVQTPYDFCNLGLHVYCSDNLVVSATCVTYKTDSC